MKHRRRGPNKRAEVKDSKETDLLKETGTKPESGERGDKRGGGPKKHNKTKTKKQNYSYHKRAKRCPQKNEA